MYVCICRQITKKDIQQAVAEGACSMRDLHKQFGLGSQCGRCCEFARDILKTSQKSADFKVVCAAA